MKVSDEIIFQKTGFARRHGENTENTNRFEVKYSIKNLNSEMNPFL